MPIRITTTILLSFLINVMNAQDQLSCTLVYTVTNNETESFYEYSLLSGKKEPFSRYLNSKAEYTISGDTLIMEKYDNQGALYFVNVQIGSSVWTGSNYDDQDMGLWELMNVSHFNVDICLVEHWYEIKQVDHKNIKKYTGETIQNAVTQFEIDVFDHSLIRKEGRYSGLFCKVLNEHGLIVKSTRTYKDQITEMILQEKIENTPINCAQKLSQYILMD